MKRAKQLKFEGFDRIKDEFGGSLLKGNPRTNRPLSSKFPIHLVLRTDTKNSMRKPKAFGRVNAQVYKIAKKYGVKVYEFANVGSHLHILIKLPHVFRWAPFIRELTGQISSGMQELKGPAKGERYWAHRPFSRVVRSWKKAYKDVKDYIVMNEWEAAGHIRRGDWKRLAELRKVFEFG